MWKDLVFFRSKTWEKIKERLEQEKLIQPYSSLLFRPMVMTKPQDVRVVFIGKEPYPYHMGAHDGFAFSTPELIKYDNGVPKYSNMLQARLMKELVDDTGIARPRHSSLLKWARQGVFLWNYTTTVRRGTAGSHTHWGWDELSREVLEVIALENPRAIFVPWGMSKYGRNSIDEIVLPQSIVYRGASPEDTTWQGSKPFTNINKILKGMNQAPINWSINY